MTGTTREKGEGKPRPGGRALREGPKPTHLQQGEEVLVFILELIPLLDQWRHQLLNVFLEREWESGFLDGCGSLTQCCPLKDEICAPDSSHPGTQRALHSPSTALAMP